MTGPVHCPACGSDGSSNWYRAIADRYRFVNCASCGLIFRDPPLWAGIEYKTYGTRKESGFVVASPSDRARGAFLFLKFTTLLSALPDPMPRGTVLDVGCGPGTFVGEIKENFAKIDAFGLDPSEIYGPDPLERFTRLTGTVEDVDLGSERFDVITMFGNFMLHKSPKTTLAALHRALKPGGTLIFDAKNPYSTSRRIVRTVPGLQSLGRLSTKIENQCFHGINLAMTSSYLEETLPKIGFEILRSGTSHSYNIQTAKIGDGSRSAVMSAIRALDELGRSRTWLDYVCRKAS